MPRRSIGQRRGKEKVANTHRGCQVNKSDLQELGVLIKKYGQLNEVSPSRELYNALDALLILYVAESNKELKQVLK